MTELIIKKYNNNNCYLIKLSFFTKLEEYSKTKDLKFQIYWKVYIEKLFLKTSKGYFDNNIYYLFLTYN